MFHLFLYFKIFTGLFNFALHRIAVQNYHWAILAGKCFYCDMSKWARVAVALGDYERGLGNAFDIN